MQIKELNSNIKRLILSISGIVLLLLVASASIESIVKSFTLGIVISIFLFKSKRISMLCDRTIKPIYLIAGIGFGLLAGCLFYSTWIPSSMVASFFSIFKIRNTIGLTCVAIIGAIFSAPLVSVVLSYLVETGIKCIQESQSGSASCDNLHFLSKKKSLFILFGIYLIGISAILRANFNYIDDMGRVALGYKGWEDFSRILSNLLSTVIHMDSYLTDVSPLPQLIAVAIMALSGVVLLVILYERTSFSVIEILALIPLCLNPYFLECISYKYDAPYMALSVFGAIMPLLYRKRSGIAYTIVSVIGTIIVCTTYQAASGIYPMLVILIMLRMWNKREENNRRIVRFCIQSAVGYSVGILVFRIFFMTTTENYVSNSLPGIKSFIPNFIQNLEDYYALICTDFKWWWLVVVLLLIVGFVWTMTYTSENNTWLAMVLSVFALLGMGILCFGLYPALTEPLFLPRAMYGFGIFLTLLMVTITEQRNVIAVKVPVLLFSWIVFVFAFTYGNALYTQKEYTDFRINQVIEDLNDLEIFNTEEEVIVQIAGSIGHSPVIDNMPQNYQMLNRLVPINFRESWWWGQFGFYNYYNLANVVQDFSIDLKTYDLPIIEDHMYHTIRGKDNYILIELK